MNPRRPSCGQSLVETALVLPVLLALLGGGYWLCTRLIIAGAAESAAHAHRLRTGRGQSDIRSGLAKTVVPGGKGVTISGENDSFMGSLPPISGLSGLSGLAARTTASADVSCPGEAVGAYVDLPPHDHRSSVESSVDCWDRDTPSGKTVRRVVQGVLLTGILR